MQMISKSLSDRLNSVLKPLLPAIRQLSVSNRQLHKTQRNPIFEQFYGKLIKGVDLIKRCENASSFNLLLHCRCVLQILKLEEEINGFLASMPAHTLLDVRRLIEDVKRIYPVDAADINRGINESIFKQASLLTNDPCQNSMMLQELTSPDLFNCDEMMDDSPNFHNDSAPGKSQFCVGLAKCIRDLKGFLFLSELSVIGVQCMGGGGKTTLALNLCNDPQIKGYFQDVVFITVSQSPNLKGIFETMWEKMVGRKMPEFQNVEDARRQLGEQLLKQSRSTLVILDDVWSRANTEKLVFERPGYKTLITTRDSFTIPRSSSTLIYQLPLLDQEDALSLFCFWAFGQTSIPSTAVANLVEQVQAECKGLPLALKVIGSSLRGEPHVVWESAKNKLSKGEPISDYHKDGLVRCLEASISFLDDIARECFLDLGAFPEDKKICADALLNMWVYVRKLEWQDAFAILLELARRNLLNLTINPGSRAELSYGNASELYFSQHDVMRDLALYLGSQDYVSNRKRLLMPRKEHTLPGKWELLNDRPFDAQIVSIHTGPMDESQWYEMNFPKTEALVLIFTASEYYLPPFMKSMRNLKYLMIFNYNSKRATLKGLDAFYLLTKLKSIRLERLISPLVSKQSIEGLQNLEKLSLSLCEGVGEISTFNNSNLQDFKSLSLCEGVGEISTFNNSNLQDFNIDHCSDLEELPLAICHMPSALTWSITNCHLVQKIPYDLGRMSSLRMLRLSALPGLKELPASIGNLVNLKYLDISVCEGLKELPEEIGQLKKLREFDMRECSRLRKLPRSVCRLSSLKHVICDDKIGNQWLKAKAISIPDLNVEIAEAQFSLDWLDD